MTTSFDPELFVQSTVEEALSTTRVPVPEGEVRAVVKDLKGRETQNGSPILDVYWAIDDQTVRDVTGLDEPTVRQSLFLDLTPNGNLDMAKGKNVDLGRLRAALGQNEAGKPWSPNMMIGKVAKVMVSQRLGEPRNPGDEAPVYNDVRGVSPL